LPAPLGLESLGVRTFDKLLPHVPLLVTSHFFSDAPANRRADLPENGDRLSHKKKLNQSLVQPWEGTAPVGFIGI